ncbi:MAG: maleylpyruvate isomerase family mycothiol-dependent enzyme [Gammaproteobacteria bacterium]|nr:MAG: maleylpyruvate isomerase family mycothiol-dependent enzyme [Gammaproteobacteria bacterium]
MRWDHERYCDAIGDEIARFADAVRGADPAAPVPTCPEWTVAELVRHAGAVHRWAGQMVAALAQERLDRRQVVLDLPADEADLPNWLAAGAAPLVGALRAADPGAPMWSWGADQHARFWSRRMLHETTVHRADAEFAVARDPAIEVEIAVDGVEELLENLRSAAYFRPNVAELRGSGQTLRFECSDTDVDWTVTLQPDGYEWRRGNGEADVSVGAAAADVLLLVYGRRRPDETRFERTGDEAVLQHWLAHSAL